jgi:hypothetical protein
LERDEQGGILFEGYLDGVFWHNRTIYEPFVGFFHNAPEHPEDVSDKYKRILSIRRLLETEGWKNSRDMCRGLFSLSYYLAGYLREATGKPVSVVRHPTEPVKDKFDFEKFHANQHKKAFCIGHWMRDFETFFKVKSKKFTKCLLMGGAEWDDHDLVNRHVANDPGTIKYDYIPDWEYDQVLLENIAFVPLYDASANNVVIECIMRETPLLINRLPAAIEYLGEDYPFFFDDVDEAMAKIDDIDLIKETADYLKKKDKTFLSLNEFVQRMVETEVYQSIRIATPLLMM